MKLSKSRIRICLCLAITLILVALLVANSGSITVFVREFQWTDDGSATSLAFSDEDESLALRDFLAQGGSAAAAAAGRRKNARALHLLHCPFLKVKNTQASSTRRGKARRRSSCLIPCSRRVVNTTTSSVVVIVSSLSSLNESDNDSNTNNNQTTTMTSSISTVPIELDDFPCFSGCRCPSPFCVLQQQQHQQANEKNGRSHVGNNITCVTSPFFASSSPSFLAAVGLLDNRKKQNTKKNDEINVEATNNKRRRIPRALLVPRGRRYGGGGDDEDEDEHDGATASTTTSRKREKRFGRREEDEEEEEDGDDGNENESSDIFDDELVCVGGEESDPLPDVSADRSDAAVSDLSSARAQLRRFKRATSWAFKRWFDWGDGVPYGGEKKNFKKKEKQQQTQQQHQHQQNQQQKTHNSIPRFVAPPDAGHMSGGHDPHDGVYRWRNVCLRSEGTPLGYEPTHERLLATQEYQPMAGSAPKLQEFHNFVHGVEKLKAPPKFVLDTRALMIPVDWRSDEPQHVFYRAVAARRIAKKMFSTMDDFHVIFVLLPSALSSLSSSSSSSMKQFRKAMKGFKLYYQLLGSSWSAVRAPSVSSSSLSSNFFHSNSSSSLLGGNTTCFKEIIISQVCLGKCESRTKMGNQFQVPMFFPRTHSDTDALHQFRREVTEFCLRRPPRSVANGWTPSVTVVAAAAMSKRRSDKRKSAKQRSSSSKSQSAAIDFGMAKTMPLLRARLDALNYKTSNLRLVVPGSLTPAQLVNILIDSDIVLGSWLTSSSVLTLASWLLPPRGVLVEIAPATLDAAATLSHDLSAWRDENCIFSATHKGGWNKFSKCDIGGNCRAAGVDHLVIILPKRSIGGLQAVRAAQLEVARYEAEEEEEETKRKKIAEASRLLSVNNSSFSSNDAATTRAPPPPPPPPPPPVLIGHRRRPQLALPGSLIYKNANLMSSNKNNNGAASPAAAPPPPSSSSSSSNSNLKLNSLPRPGLFAGPALYLQALHVALCRVVVHARPHSFYLKQQQKSQPLQQQQQHHSRHGSHNRHNIVDAEHHSNLILAGKLKRYEHLPDVFTSRCRLLENRRLSWNFSTWEFGMDS